MHKPINNSTTDVTVPLAVQFPAKSFGQNTVYIDFAKLATDHPATFVQLVEQGALRILNDGNGAKDLTDDERYAKMQKRVDAWMAGNFRVVERGDSIGNLAKECYIDEQMANHPGTSTKQIEAKMRDAVKAALGDVNATFDNFLKAVAKNATFAGDSRAEAEIYEAGWAKYEMLAKALAKRRANAGKGLDLTIDF